jgi:hypothetical protein
MLANRLIALSLLFAFALPMASGATKAGNLRGVVAGSFDELPEASQS